MNVGARVIAALVRRTDANGDAFISMSELRSDTKLRPITIKRCLRKLERAGLIVVKRRGRKM